MAVKGERRRHFLVHGGLFLVGAAFTVHLYGTDPFAGEGGVVAPTALPFVLSLAIAALAFIAIVGRLLIPTTAEAAAEPSSTAGGLRVLGVVAATLVYIGALPWLGYLVATALFAGVLGWLFGNRSPWTLLGLMVLVPPPLLYFFEKVMIVLLPESRLF